MVQIQKELLHNDYKIYWQQTGVTKRLIMYQRIQNLAEYIVIAIDIILYVILLMLMKDFTVASLAQSGSFFEIFTREQLIDGISINLLKLSIQIFLCFTFISFLWIKLQHSHFKYQIKKCFRFLCIFYGFSILLIFCLDFILTTSTYVVILLLIRKLLKLYICRVYRMTDYATSTNVYIR